MTASTQILGEGDAKAVRPFRLEVADEQLVDLGRSDVMPRVSSGSMGSAPTVHRCAQLSPRSKT